MINFHVPIYKVLFIVLIFLFSSCSKKKHDEVIKRDEFVKILTDLQKAEGIMSSRGWHDAGITDSSLSYYNFVLKKYNINRAQFDKTLEYYSQDPDDIIRIFDEVIAKINSEIPEKLNKNSIYSIINKSIERAKMKTNGSSTFGMRGTELWTQKNYFNFPNDTSRSALNLDTAISNHCLLVFQADYKIMPLNKSKKMKMNLMVQYKDSTADTIEKELKLKIGELDNYHLFLKTDSSKIPLRIKSSVFSVEKFTKNTAVTIRNVSLKAYAPSKDTTSMFIHQNRKVKTEKSSKKKDIE